MANGNRFLDWVSSTAAVPIILVGSVCFVFLSQCSPASAQTAYKEPPGKILDMVLTEKGYTLADEKKARSLVAKSAHYGATGAGKSWLGASARLAAKGAGYVGLAITAYDVYSIWTGGPDDDVAFPDGSPQFDVPAVFPVDNSWLNNLTDPYRDDDIVLTGWLNEFIECPGVGQVEACIRDAVYKDLHVKLQEGDSVWRGTDSTAEPGRVDVKVVRLTGCNRDFSQVRTDNYSTPSAFRCNYEADVTVYFTDIIDGRPKGQSNVTMTGFVDLSGIRTISGVKEDKKPECVDRPNVFPYNEMFHLCQVGPLDTPAVNLPIPLDQVNDSNLIPSWLKNTKPNSALLAALFNAWGTNVYDLPGWDGFTWIPITPADIDSAWGQSEDTALTIGDLNGPIRNPSSGYPWTSEQPVDLPGGGTTPDPGGGTDPDPGDGGGDDGGTDEPDPGVKEPDFPEIPTIQQIMDPVLNVFPDVKDWAVPVAGGECPKPELQAFDKTYVMDAHCKIAEDHRPAIGAAFMAMFSLMSVLIVLRA